MLWIALHLPLLSLESFAALWPPEPEGTTEPPLALLDAHLIVSANAAARALGVKPGLKRATALALAPQLVLGQADAARDAQALTVVAHAALAFTPSVVMQGVGDAAPHGAAPPHTVLLEVQASLRYFGGLPALLQRLRAALAPLGHRLHMVSAVTPLGAALLARIHPTLHCADLATTRGALDAAPVRLLGPGREHWEALQGMGLHTLADLKRVPRDGLARRFGEVVLSELDRATGTRPDPRVCITLPPAFDSRVELLARADTTEQLMHGAGLLLVRLVAWLSAQHAFVRRFTLVMEHEKPSRRSAATPGLTTLEVALAEPSRDSAHLLMLLRERLAQLQLPAPTLELRLHAHDIARRLPPNTELFPTPRSEHEGLTRLVERLQARLGAGQVLRLVALQEHRPERASAWRVADAQIPQMLPAHSHSTSRERSQACVIRRPLPEGVEEPRGGPSFPCEGAGTGRNSVGNSVRRQGPSSALPAPGAALAARPVWLLAPPEPLRERHGSPLFDGQPLQLLTGPERIEAGWWDAALAERDYFIAQLPEGPLVWIYRSRLPEAGSAWCLHGRFG